MACNVKYTGLVPRMCIWPRPLPKPLAAITKRGLLRLGRDYDESPPHLNHIVDPLDDEGCVHVSQEPGLGIAYNWDYIDDNRI